MEKFKFEKQMKNRMKSNKRKNHNSRTQCSEIDIIKFNSFLPIVMLWILYVVR